MFIVFSFREIHQKKATRTNTKTLTWESLKTGGCLKTPFVANLNLEKGGFEKQQNKTRKKKKGKKARNT